MSRLIIARTSATFSPAGGVRVKCVDPSVPSSSPENATNTTSRASASGLRRELARDLEDRRRPRRVVVGAQVRQVAVGRQRVVLAEAEVIVVRADHDHARRVRAGGRRRSRQPPDDVERLLGRVAERDLQRRRPRAASSPASRSTGASAARLTTSTGMPGVAVAARPRRRQRRLRRRLPVGGRVLRARRQVDDQQRARAALAREPGLLAQVAGAALALGRRQRRVLGDEAAHDDDLPAHVDARVVVDAELLVDEAVAGEHQRPDRLARRREAERLERVARAPARPPSRSAVAGSTVRPVRTGNAWR